MSSSVENFPFNHFEPKLRRDAPWFIAIGLLMIVAAGAMMTNLAIATIAVTLYVGLMMILGGALQIVHAIAIRRFHPPWLWGSFGTLYLLAGILVWTRPSFAISMLTFLLAIALLAAGMVRLMAALSSRPANWRWLIFSALLTMTAGIIVSLGWPDNSAWMLGLFLCADFLVQGVALLAVGVALGSA